VFIDGRKAATLRGPTLAEDFRKMVADYVEKRFGSRKLTEAEEGIPVAELTAANDE
jgi:(E)-4-hydroxy-3-methylbut-2-enyl-diphosphate synthase